MLEKFSFEEDWCDLLSLKLVRIDFVRMIFVARSSFDETKLFRKHEGLLTQVTRGRTNIHSMPRSNFRKLL